jgi:Putative peptidoglycan binding domain
MSRIAQFRSAAAAVFALVMAGPVGAVEPDLGRFKAEIDAFVGRLEPTTSGLVKWAGSDAYEIRREADALVAVIPNARLSLEAPQAGNLALDRLEIRQIAQKEEGKLIELQVQLPKEMILNDADGTETKIMLEKATASALVEAQSGRSREAKVTIASAHIDQAKTGTWAAFGPISIQSKFSTEPEGGWSAPVEFEAKEIRYFFPQGPVGGGIDRISFSGESTGRKLDELEKLRHAIETLQNDDDRPPEARGAAFLAILPTIVAPFSTIRSELALDAVTVSGVTDETLVSLARAATKIEVTGLDGETAALRFSLRHEGLGLAPSVVEPVKVPHRVVLDVGIADLSTKVLSNMLQAVSAIAYANGPSEDDNRQKRQQALLQALGAAAMLSPSFHIYDIAVDTENVGIDLNGEAKGSPLAPSGYSAAGDLTVRGFEEIPKLGPGISFGQYLPVLKELGVEERASDGTPRLNFHLASEPRKWLTVNGNDISSWFGGSESTAGQPRLLKLSDPPMRGDDVKSVQRALGAAKIIVEQNGIYDAATAGAVARFQKQKGINVSGVLDATTRHRLISASETPRQGGRN